MLQMAFRVVIPIVLMPLIAHHMGAEALGAYAFIMQISAYVVLVDLSIGQAMVRVIAQSGDPSRSPNITSIMASGWLFLVLAGVLACLATLALSWLLHGFLAANPEVIHQSRKALSLLALWYLFRFPLTFFSTYLYARQRIVKVGTAWLIGDLGISVSQIAFVLWGQGLPGLIVGIITGELLSKVLCFFWSWRELSEVSWDFRFRFHSLLELLKVGVPLSVISLADRLVFSSQNIVVGGLFDARTLASFHASRQPGVFLANILGRASDAAFPSFNDLYGRNQTQLLTSTFLRIAGYSVGLSIWFSFMVFLFNKPFLELWMGSPFYAGDLMTLAVALSIPVSAINSIFRRIVIVEGRLRTFTWVVLVEGIFCVLLSFFLGKMMGPPGVMLAMVFGQVFSIGFSFYRAQVLFQKRWLSILSDILKRSLSCCGIGVAACLVQILFIPSGGRLTWLFSASCLTVVTGFGFLTVGMSREDRKVIFKALLPFLPSS